MSTSRTPWPVRAGSGAARSSSRVRGSTIEVLLARDAEDALDPFFFQNPTSKSRTLRHADEPPARLF